MQATHGADLYRLVTIPGGAYRGVDAEVPVVGATNILVASSQLDEALAYDIVRLLFERQADLVAAHPEAAHMRVPSGPDASPAPFHPGAIRYYREHGWQ
jgi:TRAP transporter TAXI family solute receptor